MTQKPVEYTNDTIYPSSYNSSATSLAQFTTSNTDRFCNPATNTTYAQFSSTKYNDECYIYYDVDCSDIPADATIVSVEASVKAQASNTSYLNPRACYICSGTTTKSNQYTMANSTTAFTLTGTNITRSDLDNLRICFHIKRTRNNTTSYYIRCYGATFTIVYTVLENFYRYTINVDNGTYECEILPDTDDIHEGDSLSFSIKGTDPSDLKKLSIDNIQVTPTQVEDHWEYTKTNINSDFSIDALCSVTPVVTVSDIERTGKAVYKKINGNWVEMAEKDWPDTLSANDECRLIKGWK